MRTICYYPELAQVTGSINAALMMAQLEFWFKVMNGKPFYKFLGPCKHELYKVGDSWSEELGMTNSEIRSAFKRIGTMYKSKSAFIEAMESQDIFKGKPYAAYYDRIRKTTYYLRNEERVQEMLPQDLSPECTKDTRDGSARQEISLKRDGSAQQDTYPTRGDIAISCNLSCVNEENQCGLYREDFINHNIENSIEECREDSLIIEQQKTHTLIPYTEIVCLYNDYLGENLGYVRQLTHKDKTSIKMLWSQFNLQLEDFRKGFIKVAASNFLCGKVEGKKWQASLKWLIKGEHFMKVLAGVYDDFVTPISSVWQTNSLNKIKRFNQMESHHFDFDEIEMLERRYIDRKLASL